MGMLVSCENDIKEIERITDSDEKVPNEMFVNLEVLATDSGILKSRIFGRYVDRYVFDKKELNYMEIKDSLVVFFYDKKGKVTSKISANHAFQYEEKQFIELSGNVFFDNLQKKQTLQTEKLIWDQKKEIIYTPDNAYFRVDDEDMIITGYGLKADERFESYEYENAEQQIKM